jgi:hypothetical protein
MKEDIMDNFEVYFNVADEIYESICIGKDQSKTGWDVEPCALTLDDLDKKHVAKARKAATEFDLPWPPYLPAAEEAWNVHRNKR